MEIVGLLPQLHVIKLALDQAYLWRDGNELTLIDTGVPGWASELEKAFAELGYRKADLRRVILTHWHEDHSGSAADVRAWGDVEVLAHTEDAAVIDGRRQGPKPVLTEAEAVLFQQLPPIAPAPACRVDRELSDGEQIEFGVAATRAQVNGAAGLGAEVIGTPGHTDGSIAIYLPQHGVLFTGDIVANSPNGMILGPFNTDRELAKRSLEQLTRTPATTICFGHGDPVTEGWQLPVPDPWG